MTAPPPATMVWLVRHGQRADVDPAWQPRRCHHTEVPLSSLGEAQAAATGARLAREGLAAMVASPYLRAVQTADAIARAAGLCVGIERGAMEWQNPAWFPSRPPLESPRALAARFAAIDPSYRSLVRPRWPETLEQVRARMARTIRRLVAAFEGPLLVVGHGATVLHMAQALLGASAAVETRLCAPVGLRWANGRWRLTTNGATDHLTGSLLDLKH